MITYDELIKLKHEKLNIREKEIALYNQREKEVADLAEQCGLLTLPDDEIKVGFYNLVYNYHKH